MRISRTTTVIAVGTAALVVGATAAYASTPSRADSSSDPGTGVSVDIVTPQQGDVAGVAGKAWMVDLKLDFPSLTASGFSAPQLTGPGVHANAAPYPGTFSTGADDLLPGLVVLSSTTTSAVAGFSGPGTNLANLFNLTSVVDHSGQAVQIQDTWIVGAPIAGSGINTVLTVAVVADLNHNGVYDDAPATVGDVNHDGHIDSRDVYALGLASRVMTVRFHLNGPAS